MIDIKNKTPIQLANMDIKDFNRLTFEELKGTVQKMGKLVNRRLAQFEQLDEESPAVSRIEESGGRIYTKGLSLNQLRKEYVRARDFLKDHTSTVSGWWETKEYIVSGLEKKGVEIGFIRRHWDDFWKAYGKSSELDRYAHSKEYKYQVFDRIIDLMREGRHPDEIATLLKKEITKMYENKAELDDSKVGISASFL